jgi:transcription elongation factor GreA
VTETTEKVTWITQETCDRLTSELEHLSGPGRAEISKKIEAAREEGDLRENGGYHAAKEEQGKQEARIRQLQVLLDHARVGQPPADTGVVQPGMVVTVRMDGGDEPLRFLLGSREDAGVDVDVYSPQSPLGGAVDGKKVGESSTYQLPNGNRMAVEVLDAKPFTG